MCKDCTRLLEILKDLEIDSISDTTTALSGEPDKAPRGRMHIRFAPGQSSTYITVHKSALRKKKYRQFMENFSGRI